MTPSRRAVLAEFLGSALLAAVVIGSGIAAQQLSPHDVGLQLLENAIVTGVGLYALIVMFAPVSGAHFNPVVTVVSAAEGATAWKLVPYYVLAQVTGFIAGAVLANVMFSRAALSLSTHHRVSAGHLVAEVVATAGLVMVIFMLGRHRSGAHTPAAVGAYITAAYFFTSSTSFANPGITIGRVFSNSFAGIAPSSTPAFIGAQVVGAAVGLGVVRLVAVKGASL